MSKPSIIYFILLISLGILLRFSGLSSNPSGFYVDEASIAENAYQIMVNGKDEWQISYPIYFKAFGEYKNPLFIYSLVPIFKLLGPSIFSARFGAFLWGISTAFAIGLFAWTSTHRKVYGVLGLCLTLFLPWHFYSSRVAFEAISLPLIFSLALVATINYQQTPRFVYAWLAIVFSSLMFYSYTSARLFSPLLFIYILAIVWKKNLSRLPLLIALYFLLLLPAISWNHITHGSLFVRYEQVKEANLATNLQTYLHQFSPQLWFGTGDTNLHHTALKGLLPISFMPFFLLGLIKTIANRRQPFNALVLVILLTAPIPAALTSTDPNALRMIHLIPILVIITIMGIKQVLLLKKSLRQPLAILFTLAIIIEHTQFYLDFQRNFPLKSRWWFDAPYIELIPQLTDFKDPIWIHHYLLNSSHQVTYNYICHALPHCTNKTLNFSEKSDQFVTGATNIYFGDDCQKIKSSHSDISEISNSSDYCAYRNNPKPITPVNIK